MPASNQIAHKAEVNNQSHVKWSLRAAGSGNDNNKKVAILSHASDLSLTIQISETAPATRGVFCLAYVCGEPCSTPPLLPPLLPPLPPPLPPPFPPNSYSFLALPARTTYNSGMSIQHCVEPQALSDGRGNHAMCPPFEGPFSEVDMIIHKNDPRPTPARDCHPTYNRDESTVGAP